MVFTILLSSRVLLFWGTSIDALALIILSILLIFISFKLETQEDIISDQGIFIRDGNHKFKNIQGYMWDDESVAIPNQNEHTYESLTITMSPSNKFESWANNHKPFEIKLKVKKEHKRLVDNILKEKYELSN